MYEAPKISLNRNQLAKFLPNHETIKEFERLFRQDTDFATFINNIIEGSGLDDNGNYIVPDGSNFLDDTESLYDAILTLDTDIAIFINNIIAGVGLDDDGNYIPRDDSNYLNDSETIYQDSTILDGAIFDHTRELVITSTADTSLSAYSQTQLCDATSGEIDITLPNPSLCFSDNRSLRFAIHKIDISENAVNVLPFGSELIVGEASQTLDIDGEIYNFITDGTNWYLGA